MQVKLADFYEVSVDSFLDRQDFDVKVDIDSDRIKYKPEVEKLGEEIARSISPAVTDVVLIRYHKAVFLCFNDNTVILNL